jgi:hypothetical protein
MKFAPLLPKPAPTARGKRKAPIRPTWGFARAPGILPKLEIGAIDHPLEREADAIADRVMRMPAPSPESPKPVSEPEADLDGELEDGEPGEMLTTGTFAGGAETPMQPGAVAQRMCASCQDEAETDDEEIHRSIADSSVMRACSTCEDEDEIRRACASCDNEEEPEIRRREAAAGPRGGATSAKIDEDIRAEVRAGGEQLSGQARSFLQPRLGVDLDYLEIHTDANAGLLAQQINARAFTLGNHIFFAPGQWQPHTYRGMHLLAHEVAHTLQNRRPDTPEGPQIHRSELFDPDRVTDYIDETEPHSDFVSPENAYEQEWVLARNYIDRKGALQESLEIYFDRLFEEWDAQGFFKPEFHPGLVEEYQTRIDETIGNVADCHGEAMNRSTEIDQKISDLSARAKQTENAPIVKALRRATKDLDDKRNSHRGNLGGSYTEAKERIDKGFYDRMATAWEKNNPDDVGTKPNPYKQRKEKIAGKIAELEAEMAPELAKITELKQQLWGTVPEELANMRETYKCALLAYEAAREKARDMGITFKSSSVKSRRWPNSRITINEIKSIEDYKILMLVPGDPDYKHKPSGNDPKQMKRAFMEVRVKPKLESMSIPQLVAVLEKVAAADPNLMQPFARDAIIEFAGTPWKTAHGDWFDPRFLLRSLYDEENEGRKQKDKLRLATAIQNMQPTQALAYLVELRRNGGPAVYPDFAWAFTILKTQLYLRKEYYDELQSMNADKVEPKYIKHDSFERNVEFNRKSMESFNDPMSNRWKKHIGRWMKHSADWRRMALGTEESPGESSYMFSEAVCNEIAELTQRGCGRRLPGGLRKNARYYRQKGGIRRVTSLADLVPCRSIFWLTWSEKVPPLANRATYHEDYKYQTGDGTTLKFGWNNEQRGVTYDYELVSNSTNLADVSLDPTLCSVRGDDSKYSCAIHRHINARGVKSENEGLWQSQREQQEKVAEYEAQERAREQAKAAKQKFTGKLKKPGPWKPPIKAPSAGWLKWKHQATIAFPPFNNKVITFEPEPDSENRVSRLRVRSVNELMKWSVMVGIDDHDQVNPPGMAAAPFELLGVDAPDEAPADQSMRKTNAEAMHELVSPFLQKASEP